MWTVSSSHFITSVKAQRAGADSSPAALVTRFISLLMSQPTFQEHWTKTSEFPGATYLERLTDTCKSSHWHQRENHINWCHCRGLSSAPVLKSVNSMTPHRYVSLKKHNPAANFCFQVKRWTQTNRLRVCWKSSLATFSMHWNVCSDSGEIKRALQLQNSV